jgi:hypothetical protein
VLGFATQYRAIDQNGQVSACLGMIDEHSECIATHGEADDEAAMLQVQAAISAHSIGQVDTSRESSEAKAKLPAQLSESEQKPMCKGNDKLWKGLMNRHTGQFPDCSWYAPKAKRSSWTSYYNDYCSSTKSYFIGFDPQSYDALLPKEVCPQCGHCTANPNPPAPPVVLPQFEVGGKTYEWMDLRSAEAYQDSSFTTFPNQALNMHPKKQCDKACFDADTFYAKPYWCTFTETAGGSENPWWSVKLPETAGIAMVEVTASRNFDHEVVPYISTGTLTDTAEGWQDGKQCGTPKKPKVGEATSWDCGAISGGKVWLVGKNWERMGFCEVRVAQHLVSVPTATSAIAANVTSIS